MVGGPKIVAGTLGEGCREEKHGAWAPGAGPKGVPLAARTRRSSGSLWAATLGGHYEPVPHGSDKSGPRAHGESRNHDADRGRCSGRAAGDHLTARGNITAPRARADHRTANGNNGHRNHHAAPNDSTHHNRVISPNDEHASTHNLGTDNYNGTTAHNHSPNHDNSPVNDYDIAPAAYDHHDHQRCDRPRLPPDRTPQRLGGTRPGHRTPCASLHSDEPPHRSPLR